jgi:hypothetical protein
MNASAKWPKKKPKFLILAPKSFVLFVSFDAKNNVLEIIFILFFSENLNKTKNGIFFK